MAQLERNIQRSLQDGLAATQQCSRPRTRPPPDTPPTQAPSGRSTVLPQISLPNTADGEFQSMHALRQNTCMHSPALSDRGVSAPQMLPRAKRTRRTQAPQPRRQEKLHKGYSVLPCICCSPPCPSLPLPLCRNTSKTQKAVTTTQQRSWPGETTTDTAHNPKAREGSTQNCQLLQPTGGGGAFESLALLLQQRPRLGLRNNPRTNRLTANPPPQKEAAASACYY